MKFVHTHDGMINAKFIRTTYEGTNAYGKTVLNAETVDGDVITLMSDAESLLSEHLPNNNPDIELWCVSAGIVEPWPGDNLDIGIYPITAWRIGMDGETEAVTYQNLDFSNRLANLIHDRSRNTWVWPIAGCMYTDPEAMLEAMYREIESRRKIRQIRLREAG